MDFPYGETEIAYLRARDLKLGAPWTGSAPSIGRWTQTSSPP